MPLSGLKSSTFLIQSCLNSQTLLYNNSKSTHQLFQTHDCFNPKILINKMKECRYAVLIHSMKIPQVYPIVPDEWFLNIRRVEVQVW